MRPKYRRYVTPLLTLAVCTIAAVSSAQTAVRTVSDFPPFRLHEGAKDEGGFPTSDAKLCIVVSSQTCFPLSPQRDKDDKDADFYFGLYPKAQRIPLRSGGSLVLFFADSGGGSGSSARFALLRYEPNGSLRDLLPTLMLSNQSDHALWNVPTISDMPLLVTADFIWEGSEGHYGPHFYEIRAYRFSTRTGKYAQILKYQTSHKYRGFDNFDDPFPLLKYEKSSILRKLGVR
jgi:hypothetical protein